MIDEEKALNDLLAKGIKIPAQPSVLVELQEKLLSDDYDVRALAAIIAKDPGIAAMVFKVAGSPVFARRRAFDKLDQVLMTLGVKQTFNIVQSVALASTVSEGNRKAFEAFWNRSREIAQLASLIAEDRVSICNVFPDQAYMAGIFHECGVPVLMMRFPDYCQSFALENVCCWPNLAEEDRRFNVDHSSIGYLVARHWKLPDFVAIAIQYHHEIPRDEMGAARTMVAILQLAIHFYHRIYRVSDPLWIDIGREVMDELGIHPDDLEEYFDEVSDRFAGNA